MREAELARLTAQMEVEGSRRYAAGKAEGKAEADRLWREVEVSLQAALAEKGQAEASLLQRQVRRMLTVYSSLTLIGICRRRVRA